MDINSRLKEIEDLDSFLIEKGKLLSNVLSTLGWSENSMLDETKVQCPKDPRHWIPESSLSRHLDMCSWVKEGYSKEDKDKQPPSSRFFYQNAPSVNSLLIDKETQANILIEKGLMEKTLEEFPNIPQTYERWTVQLTPKQRLAIYDYIVKEGKLDSRHKNVTVEDLMFDFEKKDDQGDKPKSHLELMAEQRDYKRRRQSYRAKNVHITKKSYTEVMKEVIENQITFLAETRKQETTEGEDDSVSRASSKDRERTERATDQDRLSDGQRRESHHRRSRKSDSRSPPPKRKKHKRDRSRSKSRSRHRKKSRHKRKKSHS